MQLGYHLIFFRDNRSLLPPSNGSQTRQRRGVEDERSGSSINYSAGLTGAYDFFFCPRDKTEKAMATHSSTLAWKIPWTEEPGRLPSMGSHRVGHDWSDLAATAETKGPFLVTRSKVSAPNDVISQDSTKMSLSPISHPKQRHYSYPAHGHEVYILLNPSPHPAYKRKRWMQE